ncbi:site-2 protease family protein [Inhella proteolytica]|uniref:Peptidase M50 domain-containing protein n=1 Tax=Inhella proteolytica TaxID=2795029 RepID=A0A931J2A0_9BURK|nr:site-2 protease family protein [Inhella proteolytica]MBH9576835.1 hypothetical protein [Inhella proteolytica]
MDLALSLLLAAGAALLLFGLAASAMTLTAIRRLRLLPPETQALAELPAEASSALAPGLALVEALGFGAPQALRVVALSSAGRPLPQHALVLTHADGAAAYLLQLAVPDRGRVFALYFVSRTADGQTLVTRNRASIAGALDLPDTETQDLWLPSWAAVWQAHRARMRALRADASAWLRWPAEHWVAAGALAERQAFELRVQRGDYLPAGDGSFRIGARAALRMLGRAWAVFGPSQRGMADDVSPDAHPARPEHPIETFEREQQAAQGTQRSARAKWLLFLATAAAAALSFGFSMDWKSLPILLGVLLFHELGHLAAMRLCGYRDLQVFFLPFMGAAVSGRPQQPGVGKELFVLLAGPLPGLLLGLAALLWPPIDAPWLRSTAWFAVFLNMANLLPFHPLDGGKVFELLLLSRWPWAALAGRALGLLALAAWVLNAGGGASRLVFLGALLLMALGLGQQARQARLASHLRAQGRWGGLTREAALQALFQAIQTLGYGRRAWAEQKLLVEALLPLAQRPRLRRPARAAGLLLYALCLSLPLLAVALHGQPGLPSRSTPAQATDPAQYLRTRNAELQALRARLAALPEPAAQWRLLEEELDGVSEELAEHRPGQLPAAEALLRDAVQLAPRLPDPVARQVQLALWQFQSKAEAAERLALLEQALAHYDRTESAASDPALLFRATARWLETEGTRAPERRQALIDRALARGAGLAAGPDAAALRRQHLDALHAQGESAALFALLQTWQAAAPADPLLHEDLAQLQLDATVAARGAAAGLDWLDRVLPSLQAMAGPDPHPGASLRRQGLWLAESAGRADWAQTQAPLLPEAKLGSRPASWSRRFLLWISGAQAPNPHSTLRALEQAHWRGDFAAAAAAAQRWREQSGRSSLQLPDLGDASGLAARRQQLIQQARRALYERYGLQ